MRRLAGLGAVVGAIGIAAGCGGGGGGGGTPGPTKVTVVYPGPVVGTETMALVIDDSAGNLVSSTAVTSAGSEELTLPNRGSVLLVSALNTTTLGWSMVAEPPAGTTVTLVDLLAGAAPTPTPGPFQTWNITWNGVPAASGYRVYGPCASVAVSGTSASLSTALCPERTTAKLLTVAVDSSQQPIAWHETPQIPALPNTTTPISFTLDQTSRQYVSSAVLNASSGLMVSGVGIFLDDPDIAGAPMLLSQNSVPPGYSTALSGGYCPDVGAVMSEELAAFSSGGAAIRFRHLPEVPGSLAFDVAGLEPPGLPGFDGVSQTWLFTVPTGFGDGEGFFGTLVSGNSTIQIGAALPPGTQGFALPQVPASFLPPEPFTAFNGYGGVMLVDLPSVDGYAGFLEGAPFALIPPFAQPPVDMTILLVETT